MKSPTKTPQKTGRFDGITIGDEHMGPEKIEYVCSFCSMVLVKLRDAGGANEELFCSHCSIPYSMDDESVRHKQRLSVPQETEPAVASIGGVPDISLKKKVPLRGGFETLSKRGTIRFVSYQTTEKE